MNTITRFEKVADDVLHFFQENVGAEYHNHAIKLAIVFAQADHDSAVGETGISFFTGDPFKCAEGDTVISILGVPNAYIYLGRIQATGLVNTVSLRLPKEWRKV